MIEKDNLAILQEALQDELLNQIITKIDLYGEKINEIFSTIEELEEILILQIDESKKIQNNFTELEIDAKISRAIEEMEQEFQKKYKDIKGKNNSYIGYFLIGIVFLFIGLLLRGHIWKTLITHL